MKLLGFFRRIKGFLHYLSLSCRWYIKIYLYRNLPRSEMAHLLIVKKPIYGGMGSICIRSFAYFNPRFSFTVHVDGLTKKTVLRKTFLIRKISPKLLTIVLVNDTKMSWQEQKIELLVSLSGGSEIFMDADLRWNKALPNLSQNITFLVEEFEVELIELNFNPGFDLKSLPSHFMMKNTSFFSWQNYQVSRSQKNYIFEIYRHLKNNKSNNPHLDQAHLSEQLTLSLLINEESNQISFLKLEDTQYDGGIVESSYFGASGRRFGILGDMNSRI